MSLNKQFYLTSQQSSLIKKNQLSNSLSTSNIPCFSTLNKGMNIKTVKVTDMYKNLYHKDTGKAISTIISQNDLMKINEQTDYKPKALKPLLRNQSFDYEKQNNRKTDILKNDFNKLGNLSPTYITLQKLQDTNSIQNNNKFDADTSGKPSSFYLNMEKEFIPTNYKKFNSSLSQKFYCPYCTHCNSMKDENLEYYICTIRESKNIINKGFDYLIHSDILSDLEIFKDNKKHSETGHIDASKFETLLSNYPKIIATNRLSYQILAHFLDALIEDKLGLDEVIDTEILEKFKHSLLSQGQAFNETGDKLELDKELESMFDENTRKIFENLLKKKLVNDVNGEMKLNITNESKKYSSPKTLKKFEEESHTKKIKKHSNDNSEQEIYAFRKKFIILFLIFIQILSEISVECKERAVLLYKFFKLYFVEQEKKWSLFFDKMNTKIKYYKDLCKRVIQQKNKHLKVESINDILFSNKLTLENLMSHKKLIEDLLAIMNEKREEIYMLNTNLEIVEKEIRLWIYDYDLIKCCADMRNKLSNMNTQKIVHNITEEMSHKILSKEEKSMLINADRFIMISGQRGYFYEQKEFLSLEIERLNNLYKKNYYKKREWKKKYNDSNNEYLQNKNKLLKEVANYRDRLMTEKISIGINTEIDKFSFSKMIKSHETVMNIKNLVNIIIIKTHNKLANFIDRIKHGCSKNIPISKKSLLYLIPELYNEKIYSDNKLDLANKRRMGFEDFLYNYMKDKFKLRKIIKKHCEETILSIQKYSSQDSRIDLIRRFLGLSENKLRSQILDLYLVLLKALPISFFKIFEDDNNTCTMNTECCYEIYQTKFEFYKLFNENKDNIMKQSTVWEKDNEINMNFERKLDCYLLSRFYYNSQSFVNEQVNLYNSGKPGYVDMNKFYDLFSNVNKLFDITRNQFDKIIEKFFSCKLQKLEIEEFFEFFSKKYIFKIKIIDFIDISMTSIISIYSHLEKKIISTFESVESKHPEIIFFKEFQEILGKVLDFDEYKWKMIEFFK